MSRDDDERSVDEGRWVDDETTIISDGRHATSAAAPGGDLDAAAEGADAEVPATGGPNAGVIPGGPADASGPASADAPADGSSSADGSGSADDSDPAVGAGSPDGGAEGTSGSGGAYGPPAIDPPTADANSSQVSLPPGPALVAVGLGLLTKNGWVFQDINLTLRQSSVAAIVGPAGSGRTSLLLALVGRMEANTGSLTIAGHSLQDRPRNIRMVTSVARAGRLTFPEPGLTVSESVAERCLIEDENVLAGRSRFEEACTALRLEVDPSTLVGRLAGERATLLAVALACVRVSAVMVLDDLDRDVSAATQQRMMDALIRLAKAMGPTIVVTTTDRIPVMEADVVLDLTPMDGAAIWELDPRNAPTEVILRQLDGYSPSPWAAQLPVVDADPNGPGDTGAAPGGEFPGDQGSGEQGSGDQGSGEGFPGHDAPGADPDSGHLGGAAARGSDFDGRWSRERWESTPGAGQPGLADHPDAADEPDAADAAARPSASDQPGAAGLRPTDPADPHGTSSTDRGGDATDAPGPTEDPR